MDGFCVCVVVLMLWVKFCSLSNPSRLFSRLKTSKIKISTQIARVDQSEPTRVPALPKNSRSDCKTCKTLTLQPFLFWKKAGETPKKSKGFSLRGTPKMLEKKVKTHKEARQIGLKSKEIEKKQGHRKRQGWEGQGKQELPEFNL